MRKNLFACGLLVLGVLAISHGQPIAAQGPAGPSRLLGLVRTVNTLEATELNRSGSYKQLRQILEQARQQLGQMQLRVSFTSDSAAVVEVVDAASGSTRRYMLTLVLSGTADQYAVALVPETGCDDALFTDNRAVIYTGKSLGCPLQ